MKTSKIFVPTGAAMLSFSGGVTAVAVYPIQKGGKRSYALTGSGKLIHFSGSRINGKGIPRHLTELGYQLAPEGHIAAAKLADMVDCLEGRTLVENAMSDHALAVQRKFSGKICTFVPFSPTEEVRQVEIEQNVGYTSVLFDLDSGFTSSLVKTVYKPGSGYLDISLTKGWLVSQETDITQLPRLTESRELIEHAIYAICNSGLGELVGPQNLVWPDEPAEDEVFTRGKLTVALANGDTLVAGGTADDLLAVHYIRNNKLLYARQASFSDLKMGSVIGDIAAVMVRVAELDAQPVKKALKKAA